MTVVLPDYVFEETCKCLSQNSQPEHFGAGMFRAVVSRNARVSVKP